MVSVISTGFTTSGPRDRRGYRFNDGLVDLQLNALYEVDTREVAALEQRSTNARSDGCLPRHADDGQWAIRRSYATPSRLG